MTDFPSIAPTPALAAAFPTRLLNVEKLVGDYLLAFATNTTVAGRPAINDPRPGAPVIEVVRGWPSYPGHVPVIGISAGTETQDDQHDLGATQFAGTVYAYNTDGSVAGAADYYAEPLYSPIILLLIHENRDERDRLHQELWRILTPLRRTLPKLAAADTAGGAGLVKKVRVDSEKQEGEAGPDVSDEPMIVYQSVFTVHVYHEMLQAEDVVDASGVIDAVNLTVAIADSGS